MRERPLVVWAIRDGRDAATQIERYLKSKENKNKSEVAANKMDKYKKNKKFLKKF